MTLGGIVDNDLDESLVNVIYGYALNFSGGHERFQKISTLLSHNASSLEDADNTIFTI